MENVKLKIPFTTIDGTEGAVFLDVEIENAPKSEIEIVRRIGCPEIIRNDRIKEAGQ